MSHCRTAGPGGAGGRPVERAARVRSPAGGSQPVWRVGLCAFLMGMTSGCYVYTPIAAPPEPGDRVAIELNDRGRAGLGESIGSAASKIEGMVQTEPDTAYVLSVVSVQYLNGQANKWSGERLTVSRDFVRDVRERQFSKSRSWLTAAAVSIGVVALVASRGLLGLGSSDRDPPDIPPIEQ